MSRLVTVVISLDGIGLETQEADNKHDFVMNLRGLADDIDAGQYDNDLPAEWADDGE
jgi:hypothetical protein